MKFRDLNLSEKELNNMCIIKDNDPNRNRPCFICKEPTEYIDYCSEARICSTECLHEENEFLNSIDYSFEEDLV